MTEPQLEAGREAAGRYLRELLLRPGRYRQLWESRAQRSRPGAINHLAVADVLAQYLWNSPRVSGHSDVLPHQLKDTVGRALSGRLLSRSTLNLFVAAFGFSEQEQERLWRLWRGTGRITVLAGPRAMRSGAAAEVAGVLGPRRHQTVSLHDHVYADAERKLALDAGYQLEAVLTTDDLVRGDNCFFAATGITDGELLQGVHYHEFGATTQSLVMRSKSGTLRKIDANHALHKLSEFSSVSFD